MTGDDVTGTDGIATGQSTEPAGNSGGRPAVTRRRLLATAGVAAASGLAGCNRLGGPGGSGGTGGEEANTPGNDGTETTAPADDAPAWPTYQRDDRNTGVNPNADALAEAPSVDWVGKTGSSGGIATVADGVVYVGTSPQFDGTGKVHAFDADSGDTVWTYDVGVMVDAAPTVAEGTVVFPARDGKVYALSAEDGSERWVRSEVDGTPIAYRGTLPIEQSGVTVSDGTAYLGSNAAGFGRPDVFYGFDLATGETELVVDGTPEDERNAWKPAENSQEFVTTPAIVEGTAYVASQRGWVFAIDLGAGRVSWATQPEAAKKNATGGAFRTSPAVLDGTVYVANEAMGGGNVPHLYALDAGSGATKWTAEVGTEEFDSRAMGGILLAHGAVVVSDMLGTVHAVERTDGSERWTFDTKDQIFGAASADAGRIYVGDVSGLVYALDPASGDLVWQVGSEIDDVMSIEAAPTVAGDALYVPSHLGNLVALR